LKKTIGRPINAKIHCKEEMAAAAKAAEAEARNTSRTAKES